MICELKPYKPRTFLWRRAFVYWPRVIREDDDYSHHYSRHNYARHFVWLEWAWVKGYMDSDGRQWSLNPPIKDRET